jgi:hypothetical protein
MYQLWLHGIDSTISFDSAVQKVEKLTRERRARIYLEEIMREERRVKLGLDVELTRDDQDEDMIDEEARKKVFTRDGKPPISLNIR